MLRYCLFILAIFFLTGFNTGTDLLNCAAFKITIVTKGQEIEWEYENPDEFEYEVGNKVMKGKRAKKEVERIYNVLQLKENTDAEEIKHVLEKQGFDSIDKFVIRLKYFNEELITWSWVR